MTIPDYTLKDVARFWSKVDKSGGEDACWLWTAGKNAKGYGTVFWKHRSGHLAHRIAYELTFGMFADDLLVCHRCDNPQCINPNHLFLGTQADNAHDRDMKGRRTAPRGERHHGHKLDTQQVAEIRIRYARDRVFMRELAAEYGVGKSQIFRIIHNKKRQWD